MAKRAARMFDLRSYCTPEGAPSAPRYHRVAIDDHPHPSPMQPVRQDLRSGEAVQPVRVRRSFAGSVRPGQGAAELEPRLDRERTLEHVALCSRIAGVKAERDRVAR